MNKRQGVYTTDDKSYRGSDRDACRGTVARIATRRPSPPPPLEAEVGSNVSNAEFNVLCSVFERFRAIESAAPRKRGSRRTTPLPPPTPDRAVSRSLSLSLYPFRPAPPSSSSPCLSVSPWLRTANTPGGSTHLRHLTSDQPSQPSIHSAYLPTHLPTYRHLFTRLSSELVNRPFNHSRATRHLRQRRDNGGCGFVLRIFFLLIDRCCCFSSSSSFSTTS